MRRYGVYRTVLSVAIAAAAAVSVTPSVSASDKVPQAAIDQAARFRGEFGLATDAATIQSLEADHSVSRKYGVALSPSETADIDARVVFADKVRAIAADLETRPDFGGLYTDQKGHATLVVATTARVPDMEAVLRAEGLSPAQFKVRHVEYAWSYLLSVAERIRADWSGQLTSGAIRSVGADVVANRVRIGLASLGGDVAASLVARYGSVIDVGLDSEQALASCSWRDNCVPPVKGGMDIGCTTGFSARTSSGEAVVVTAGHCYTTADHVYTNPSGTYVGDYAGTTVIVDPHDNSGSRIVYADAAYISLKAPMTASNAVLMYPGAIGHITATRPTSQVYKGDPICKSGIRTGWSCGTVTQAADTWWGMNQYTLPVRETSADTIPGDSGGTVLAYNSSSPPSADSLVLIGITHGLLCADAACTHGPGSYSPVDRVTSALGLTACTSDCGASFVSLSAPARIVDSRPSVRLGATTLSAQSRKTFAVAGRGGVPSNAVAITGNLTVTNQTEKGYLAVAPSLPAGSPPPTSTLNFPVGDNRANGVTVGLSSSGGLDIMYWAPTGKTADFIFDVTGYYVNTTNGTNSYHPYAARVLDTRPSTHVGTISTLRSQVRQRFTVAGISGVPTNSWAIAGNVTVTNQKASGYVALAPSLPASGAPPTSTLNFPVGDNRANNVVLDLYGNTSLDVIYWASDATATADVIFDVTGYFTHDDSGATYHPIAPIRMLDSRSAYRIGVSGSFTSAAPQRFAVWHNVSSAADPSTWISNTARGVSGNATVTNQTALGYFTVRGGSISGIPSTSTINFPLGDTRANGVYSGLDASGGLSAVYVATSGQTADLIFDVTGYFSY